MGKTLIIKGADFSANRLKRTETINVTQYKSSGWGYAIPANQTIGYPLTPNTGSNYDAFFIPIQTTELQTKKFVVPAYQSAGSSFVAVAILDNSQNLLGILQTAPSGDSYISSTEISSSLSVFENYQGETFYIFVCQNKSTYQAFKEIISQEI